METSLKENATAKRLYTAMDSQDIEPEVKRFAVDQPKFSFTGQDKQLGNVLSLFVYIGDKFYTDANQINWQDNTIDLDVNSNISRILFNVYGYNYNYVRNLKTQTDAGKLYGDKLEKIGDKSFQRKFLHDEFTEIWQPEWDHQAAKPLVYLLTAFDTVKKEVQTLNWKFTWKNASSTEDISISSLRLPKQHLPLLFGATFGRNRRLEMLQTLGPLTLAIQLTNSRQMIDNLKEIFINSIQHLYIAEDLANALASTAPASPYEYRSCLLPSVVKALGNLLLITGTRHSHKIHFPLMFVVKCFTNAGEVNFNLSGIEGLQFYDAVKDNFLWKMQSSGAAEDVAQVVFHAMFGTYTEDLGVLKEMTGGTIFKNRKALNLVFKRPPEPAENAPRTDPVIFKPIGFKYISKSANESTWRYNFDYQIMICPVFAGPRIRFYSDPYNRLFKRKSGTYGTAIGSLVNQLFQMRAEYAEIQNSGKVHDAVSVKWFEKGADNAWIEKPGFAVKATGELFFL